MNSRQAAHSGLTLALVTTLPTLALFGARFVLPSPGPADAEAAALDLSVSLTMPVSTPLTPEQAELVRVFGDQSSLPFGPCPVVVRAAPTEPVPGARIKEPDLKVRAAKPRLALTSIMIAGGELTAVINGKLRKAGEEVAPDWTITHIDGDAGTVLVSGKDGETLTLELRLKLSK